MHDIPRTLRAHFGGSARFAQPLGTDNEEEAKARAALYEARWRSEINSVRKRAPDGIERDAAFWRKEYVTAPPHQKDSILGEIKQAAFDDIVLPGAVSRGVLDFHDPRYDNLPEHETAARFVALATGQSVPLDDHLEDYLATLRKERKSIDMQRSTIRRFCTRFPFTGDVVKREVQRWVDEEAKAGRAPKTIGRALSELRGYWAYLQSIQVVPEDLQPLEKLAVPKPGKGDRKDPREPFKATEVVTLYRAALAQGDQELADLIALAMFTGCRLEELCALPVGKVGKDAIDIEDAKTPAGWRQVPIHSKLAPILARLIGDRTEGFVLEGLSSNKYGDRSNAIGKRFGRLKKELGFGKGRVFHSIRNTVATLLENAHVPENVAADIVGHEKPRITYGLYSGGTTLEVRRKAIEKLTYPGF